MQSELFNEPNLFFGILTVKKAFLVSRYFSQYKSC